VFAVYPCTLGAMCWESGRGTTALSECFLFMNKHVYNGFTRVAPSSLLGGS
jgi:hypothetical protein